MTVRAFVSLGSNLGDRVERLSLARRALIATPGLRLAGLSAAIETDPVDVLDQPTFLNQVVRLDVTMSPRELLDRCLGIERELGRERREGRRGGPRTIDLDILLFDGRSVDEPGLRIPHPRLHERAFFLRLSREAGAPVDWLPVSVASSSRAR